LKKKRQAYSEEGARKEVHYARGSEEIRFKGKAPIMPREENTFHGENRKKKGRGRGSVRARRGWVKGGQLPASICKTEQGVKCGKGQTHTDNRGSVKEI